MFVAVNKTGPDGWRMRPGFLAEYVRGGLGVTWGGQDTVTLPFAGRGAVQKYVQGAEGARGRAVPGPRGSGLRRPGLRTQGLVEVVASLWPLWSRRLVSQPLGPPWGAPGTSGHLPLSLSASRDQQTILDNPQPPPRSLVE